MKMTKLVSMSTVAATVLSGLVLAASPVQAATWTARKPAEIQITKGQKVYTIQWGDTLWAISQRTNITVAKLAQLNGVANPSFIMTGATLTLDWSQAGTATATMTAPDGTVTGQSAIQQQDKVDPAKSVGTTVSGSKVKQAAGQTASSATNEQSSTTTPSEPASSVASSSQATNSGTSSASSSSKESGSTNANPSSSSSSSAVPPSSSSSQESSSSASAIKPSTPSSSSAASSSADQPSTPSTPSEPVVTQKVLGVPFVSQGNTMLCEGSSLLEGLLYKGYTTQNLSQFVQSMPISADNNPYDGYSGEWRHNVDGTYQGMMATPVVQWAAKYGSKVVNISGQGTAGIKREITNGNSVVAWITYDYAAPEFKQMSWGRAVWNGHVVNVDGSKDGAYHVVDPVFGARWINAGTFENAFNVTGMAVAIR
ncbi:LysM peptidoglycan-binding domain-containing protein [Lactobacillus paracasei subsp. paracasei]|uniref:C39 family peptidase n=1 Tax=Lacticaseibacillus paracasei TaxID=1597 RepID=UPI0018C645B4|nr:C39 family peptidase [Lacticaseibacillus paracasei]MBG1272160.1 LysM peptidoglycan-binding domain-containing protein [Lacticaseibacillus paracasei subsp. paracasei]